MYQDDWKSHLGNEHSDVAIILKSMAQILHAELYNEALCVALGDMNPESIQLSKR